MLPNVALAIQRENDSQKERVEKGQNMSIVKLINIDKKLN